MKPGDRFISTRGPAVVVIVKGGQALARLEPREVIGDDGKITQEPVSKPWILVSA